MLYVCVLLPAKLVNGFTTDRSNSITHMVLFFVVCGVTFEISHLINPFLLFFSTPWLHGEAVFGGLVILIYFTFV
jgi:hypothetical protein